MMCLLRRLAASGTPGCTTRKARSPTLRLRAASLLHNKVQTFSGKVGIRRENPYSLSSASWHHQENLAFLVVCCVWSLVAGRVLGCDAHNTALFYMPRAPLAHARLQVSQEGLYILIACFAHARLQVSPVFLTRSLFKTRGAESALRAAQRCYRWVVVAQSKEWIGSQWTNRLIMDRMQIKRARSARSTGASARTSVSLLAQSGISETRIFLLLTANWSCSWGITST